MPIIEQIFPSLTWRIRQVTMYPDRPFDFVKIDNDFEGIHFGLYVDHELTGVVSLFIANEGAQFRKLAILPKAQSKGLGTQLMHYLIDFCKVQKLTHLWCNARVTAKEFYTKLGFKESNQKYSASGFEYVRMELQLDSANIF